MQESRTRRQLTLCHGKHRTVVVELGAALRSCTVGDRAVIDGFAARDRITGGRGQVLVPWPDRIRDGRYSWDGQDLQVPLTEPTGGNAIRGLLRWAAWPVVEASDSRAALEVPLWPQPGCPFRPSEPSFRFHHDTAASTAGCPSSAITAQSRCDALMSEVSA